MQSAATAVWDRLAAWPRGYVLARYNGRRYGVSTSQHTNGRSMKLYAEELGGTDRISLNIYAPAHGELALKPCEMPLDKVTAFVLGAELEAA
jgi:hypothetical protein